MAVPTPGHGPGSRRNPTQGRDGEFHQAARGMLPSGHSAQRAGLPGKLPAFWEPEAAVYHQENTGGGAEGAHRLFLSRQDGWMESPLCRLPSAQSRGSPGGQPGHLPWACEALSEALQLLWRGGQGSPLRERGSQDLPVSPQPFLSSQPPLQPPQSRLTSWARYHTSPHAPLLPNWS